MLWGFNDARIWKPRIVRTFHAYVEETILRIKGPDEEWAVNMDTRERAIEARNFIRQNGVMCSPAAVRNLLSNL